MHQGYNHLANLLADILNVVSVFDVDIVRLGGWESPLNLVIEAHLIKQAVEHVTPVVQIGRS